MPSGGRRQGRSGRAYPNRTDLNAQPIRSAPSTTYGSRVASERQQAALPLPQSQGVPPNLAALMAPAQGSPPDAPALLRDTEHPNEPVTAGMGIGPGAGPSMNLELSSRDLLEAALRKYPTPELRALINTMDD